MTDPASEARRAPWRPVHPGPPPPDQAERDRIAGELDTSLLVEAGAGSGKTTALLERMVALLAEGRAEVHEIAAITFTKKAAAELREGFQIALEEAIDRVREADGYEADGYEAELVRLDAGLRDIERAFIGTIHAFCARLLRERPIDAGLDPAFSELVDVEAEEHRTRFWHAWLDRLQASEDPVLPELREIGIAPGDLFGAFETLDDYRDVAFEARPVERPEPAEARREIEQFHDDALPHLPDEEPEKGWGDLQKALRRWRYLRRTAEWTDDVAFLDQVLAKVVGWEQGDETQNRWGTDREEKARAKALSERLEEIGAEGGEAHRVLTRWWAHRYPAALGFGRRAASEYAAERRRAGRLTFQDLLLLAARLLRENPSARRQLGERYRYLLVDEFQDTDPIQAEVIFLLAGRPDPVEDDWRRMVPRPGALFVVGDPKQSIYRFRRADIAVYRRVRERFEALSRHGVGGVVELTANFRSRPAIGRFVDDEFADRFREEADERQAAFAPLRTQRDPAGEDDGAGVFCYTIEPASGDHASIASADAETVAAWIQGRIDSGERAAGDFLILPYRKSHLTRYAEALEARNVPVQVTGGEIPIEEEISELKLLLRALVDPSDPTLTVAVLIGPFFGFSHEVLTRHREEGGSFRLLWKGQPAGDVADALSTLRRWWKMSRSVPADAVVETILADLGLLPYAAAGRLGAVRAGAIGYLAEAVRKVGAEGDTSLRAAVAALDAALSHSDAESPLEPGREDVVRVMNLHKAKGTEAPVVILADPAGRPGIDPTRRVVRGEDGTSRGWLEIVAPTRYGKRILARPLEWPDHAAEEARFRAAERDRLLYVATTRAEDELLVGRPTKGSTSFWEPLYACLERDWPAIGLSGPEPPERARLERGSDGIVAEAEAVRADFEARKEPSWIAVAASSLAKVEDEEELRAASGGRGTAWGSAVHAALEAALRGLEGEELRAACRSALVAHERPPGPAGEPEELDELVELVEAIRSSDLFARARGAEACLPEVPFAWRREVDGEVRLVEGVVDLAFREPDGWVLVDWKTDEVEDEEVLAARRRAYECQLAIYAEAWEALTGEVVKARELRFVRSAV
ncbi:MAG: UvrD-helicase domain-containing protein [Gemmatimonadota bacterium]|nr:UvrD-helicase domain-containing protein [Gemmatimonadota bacterium]